MSDQLLDEIISINSIYGPDTLEISAQSTTVYVFTHPAQSQITVRVDFPLDYPDGPPSILGTQATGPDVAKGMGQQFVELLRNVLTEIYTPGIPCVYDLIEESTTRLQQLGVSSSEDRTEGPQTSETNGQKPPSNLESLSDRRHQHGEIIGEDPPWTLSDAVTEKKSIFIARAAAVSTPQQAKQYVQHLLATDKKAAKATHNITAWRIHGDNGTQFQDCDDDGETAAGGRVLHLLELMGVWNVMVIVTRWYGGVLLGPDRFRIINQVARDAIVKSGLTEEGTKKKNKT